MTAEADLLARAHALFSGEPERNPVQAVVGEGVAGVPRTVGAAADGYRAVGAAADGYRTAAAATRSALTSAQATDVELAAILAALRRDHQQARHDTGAVLAAALRDADASASADNPVAAREALRRRHRRLSAQRSHVLSARRRARRRHRALRALRYLSGGGRAGDGVGPHSRAQAAVRAALSRLGSPYVWGAAGPNRFDCSGLVKWAYAQAGVPLHRTTYDQINEGIPVPRSQVQPGDLVFPHAGHVQLAIGGTRVIEAPYPGATVQISPLGNSIAIRRPQF